MKKTLFSAVVLSVLFMIFAVFNLSGQSNNDKNACKFARKDSTVETWKFYLQSFPDGICADEAKSAVERANNAQDQNACNAAKSANTIQKWQNYLNEFPNGKCAFEAKVTMRRLEDEERASQARKQLEKIHWSNPSRQKMSWYRAVDYCRDLSEGGHNGWRLPTEDELRNAYILRDEIGGFKSVYYWSSSTRASYTDHAWRVDFGNGDVYSANKTNNDGYVRCVR